MFRKILKPFEPLWPFRPFLAFYYDLRSLRIRRWTKSCIKRCLLLHCRIGSYDGQGGSSCNTQRIRWYWRTVYRDFFTGKKGDGGRGAMFSDSSDTEKDDFASELRFRHPDRPDERLFCPWHGKVQTPQLRVHFSHPIRADVPLYVVYVGPKLTKR